MVEMLEPFLLKRLDFSSFDQEVCRGTKMAQNEQIAWVFDLNVQQQPIAYQF